MKKRNICYFDKVRLLDLILRIFIENKSSLSINDIIGISKTAKEPTTTIKFVRTRSNNWITSEILSEISKRRKLHRDLKSDPNNLDLKSQYITSLIRIAKREFVSKKIVEADGNARYVWDIINKEFFLHCFDRIFATCQITKRKKNFR